MAGVNDSVSQFIGLCDSIARNNGIIIPEGKYYNKKNLKILMDGKRNFIMEIEEAQLPKIKKMLKIDKFLLILGKYKLFLIKNKSTPDSSSSRVSIYLLLYG